MCVVAVIRQMSYHNERVRELQNLYRSTFPEDERAEVEWDLDVATLSEVSQSVRDEKSPLRSNFAIV